MTPTMIGRYELKEAIGRGGMATVFRGYDPRFRRDVAVKVMTLDFMGDETLRARFDREAQTIASLEHPAIVPVYDFGEEQNRPYLVMRLMSGGTLTDRLKNGPLSVEETATILRRIGSALERAHQKGIIHRDLKPSNIMFDEYGDAYLADFGIARVTESAVTLTGEAVVGTPAYMSPEQVNGDKALDGRSDIYALGIICFEMLTGIRPFQGDTAARIMMKHLLDPVPDIRQVKPDLPAGTETVIARSLAKNPEERYARAGELSDTLSRLVQGEPPVTPLSLTKPAAAPPTTPPAPLTPIPVPAPAPRIMTTTETETALPYPETEVALPYPETEVMVPAFAQAQKLVTEPAKTREEQPVRGRNKWLFAGALGVVALFVLLGGGLLLANRLNQDTEDTGNTNNTTDALADDESNTDESAPSPTRTPRPTATVDPYPEAEEHMARYYELMDQGEFLSALQEVNAALELVEDPWYLHERAYAYFQLGQQDAAFREVNALIAAYPENPDHYVLRGIFYRDNEQLDSALSDHLRAVELDPNNAYFHHELASTYREIGDPDALNAAIAEWDTAISLNQEDYWYYLGQADAYFAQENLDAALARLNEAVTLFPNVSLMYVTRAKALMWQFGDADAARSDLDHALLLDPHDPDIVAHLGLLYLYLYEDPEMALPYFDQAITMAPDIAWVYGDRGICQRKLGNYDAALADFAQLSALEPGNEWPYLEQGWLFLDELHQPQEALAAFDQAIAINPESATGYQGRGLALQALEGDPAEILDAWASCIAYNPEQYWCYWDKAHLYNELGQIDEARANFQLFLDYIPEEDCPECQQEAQDYLDEHDG